MKRGQAAASLDIEPGRGTPVAGAPRAFRPDLIALVRSRTWALLSEPLAQPSARALALAGALMLFAHPLLYLLWTRWLPQPHEDLRLRVVMALAGVGLLLAGAPRAGTARRGSPALAAGVLLWLALPLFHAWLAVANSWSTVSLVLLAVAVLLHYALADWRVAAAGSLAAMVAALLPYFGAAAATRPPAGQLAAGALLVAASWAAGIGFGLLARSLRRRHVEQSLAMLATAAREMRTPLATLRLVAESLRQFEPGQDSAARLATLAQRLERVLHRLDRQVETQVANTQLMRTQHGSERIGAMELVQAVLCDFPFRSAREASLVQVRVLRDFQFVGTRQLYFQAVDNLVRNALRSLARCPQASAGDLLLEIDQAGGVGRIRVADRGLGIAPEVQARLFEPLASADAAGGVGLGLAFCQRVVQAANGRIDVASVPGQGASFTIELPAR